MIFPPSSVSHTRFLKPTTLFWVVVHLMFALCFFHQDGLFLFLFLTDVLSYPPWMFIWFLCTECFLCIVGISWWVTKRMLLEGRDVVSIHRGK